MDIWIPVVIASMSLYFGKEMRDYRLPKFGIVLVVLGFAFSFMYALGVPKVYWRPVIALWAIVIAVAMAIIFRYYQPPERT